MAVSKFRIADSGIYELGREPETTGERVSALHEAARMLAKEQVEEFQRQLRKVAIMAADINRAGDMIPVGLRDIAMRMGTEAAIHSKAMEPLIVRFWPEQPKRPEVPNS